MGSGKSKSRHSKLKNRSSAQKENELRIRKLQEIEFNKRVSRERDIKKEQTREDHFYRP